MIVRILVGIALALAFARPAPAADSLSFDDPGMHFNAPDGWTRVDPSQLSNGSSDRQEDAPAAIFLYHAGQNDQRAIVIDIAPFDGTLEGFESHHESSLHSGANATFVEKKTKLALANGMPAYSLRISSGSDAGHFLRRYEYLIYDGTRSIVISYAGRQGDFDDKEVQAAFATLYVVAYPRKRP